MVINSSLDDILQYRDNPRVSQSYLKDVVLRGKRRAMKYLDQVTGDVVDIALTVPEFLDDLYCSFDGKIPSDRLMEILTDTMEYLIGKDRITANIADHRQIIMKIAKDEGFDSNKSEAVLWESIKEKASAWWQFTIQNLGKSVVTNKDLMMAHTIAEYAQSHPNTRGFLAIDLPGRVIYNQLYLPFTAEGVDCKVLIDRLIVSPEKRKVVIVEIKTIFSTNLQDISLQIKKFKYHWQTTFQYIAVSQNLKNIGAVDDAGEYEIEAYWVFIPKDIRDNGAYFVPVVWPCTVEMMDLAYFGGKKTSDTYFLNKTGKIISPQVSIMGIKDALIIYKNAVDQGLKDYKVRETLKVDTNKANELFFT